MTAPETGLDPALGGLDEDLARLRRECSDPALPTAQRREAAREARGIRRSILVLTGRSL